MALIFGNSHIQKSRRTSEQAPPVPSPPTPTRYLDLLRCMAVTDFPSPNRQASKRLETPQTANFKLRATALPEEKLDCWGPSTLRTLEFRITLFEACVYIHTYKYTCFYIYIYIYIHTYISCFSSCILHSTSCILILYIFRFCILHVMFSFTFAFTFTITKTCTYTYTHIHVHVTCTYGFVQGFCLYSLGRIPELGGFGEFWGKCACQCVAQLHDILDLNHIATAPVSSKQCASTDSDRFPGGPNCINTEYIPN